MKPSQLTAGAAFAALLGFATLSMVLLEPALAQPQLPGYIGELELKPMDYTGADSWWYDTDGVDPGTAGCHVGVESAKDKTPNGRTFGEACKSTNVLIESNPGKDVIHEHAKDVGHPYLVKCDAWCKNASAKGGICIATVGPLPCATSARCACN